MPRIEKKLTSYMKELQLVTKKQAIKLKKCGFDGKVYNVYFDEVEEEWIASPSVALALKWLRDEKGLFGYISYIPKGSTWYGYQWHIYSPIPEHCKELELCLLTDSYEEAEIDLLSELLIVLKKEEKR
jgi:hypothetical protein